MPKELLAYTSWSRNQTCITTSSVSRNVKTLFHFIYSPENEIRIIIEMKSFLSFCALNQKKKKLKWKHLHNDFLRNWISYEKLQVLSWLQCNKAKFDIRTLHLLRYYSPIPDRPTFVAHTALLTCFFCTHFSLCHRLKHYSSSLSTRRSLIVLWIYWFIASNNRRCFPSFPMQAYCSLTNQLTTTDIEFKFLISFRILLFALNPCPLKFHATFGT